MPPLRRPAHAPWLACTVASGALLLLAATPSAAATCASLAELELPATTIRSADVVPAGAFTPPGADAALSIPSICRVAGVTQPAVAFEVWLPVNDWNGKFHVSGNGGMAGVISYAAMAGALRRGYAAASTDTGHVRPGTGGFDASWAIGRPDLVEDFGHRALHVTAENGKAITTAFYDRPPRYSYYVGCSKGGQQGLMEAQRYPDDFDGIVAGNPANDWTRFYAGAHLWYAQATLRDSGSYMPPAKLPALAAAVNAACDALDGIEDGVLDDPRQCRFDPAVLTCPYGEDHDGCLTPPQVQAVKDIRAGSRDSAGETIFPGLVPGGENGPGGGWGSWVTGREPFTSLHWLAAEGFFKYMVFEDPDWNFRTFDFDADLAFALDKVGAALDSASPDLGTFRDGGSKLIVYHGWSDPDISPLGSINYYENVLATAGGADAADGGARDRAISETQAFFRLFLVPGMGHCSGGPGYNRVDPLPALERWVEDGIAPDTILGTRVEGGEVVRSRPVCAYPGASTWDGAGDPDDAASFRCDASTYASRR
jgi:feruloyl esterase